VQGQQRAPKAIQRITPLFTAFWAYKPIASLSRTA
jgi:hypothetical protein